MGFPGQPAGTCRRLDGLSDLDAVREARPPGRLVLVAGSGYFFVDFYVLGGWFDPGVVLGHAVAH